MRFALAMHCTLVRFFLFFEGAGDTHKTKEDQGKKEVSSLFQREGVNPLLGGLSKKFPPQFFRVRVCRTTNKAQLSMNAKKSRSSITDKFWMLSPGQTVISTRAKFTTSMELGIVWPHTWLELDRVGYLRPTRAKFSPVWSPLANSSQLSSSCFIIVMWLCGRIQTIFILNY